MTRNLARWDLIMSGVGLLAMAAYVTITLSINVLGAVAAAIGYYVIFMGIRG